MADQQLNYIFTPGVEPVIVLPPNGNDAFYTSILQTGLSGSVSLSACYDKYGILWKWSNFETGNPALPGTNSFGLSALSSVAVFNSAVLSTQVAFPSSWSTTECILTSSPPGERLPANGPFPKKWTNEGSLSADLFNKFPTCSAATVIWTVSSQTGWSTSTIIPLSVSERFPFSLRLEGNGLSEYTVDREVNTNLLLNVQLTATCVGTGNVLYNPTINETFLFTSVAPPNTRTYTSNRFVLTGANVNFENLLSKKDEIYRIDINFDDNKKVTLTGSDIFNNYFVNSWENVGFKTVTFTIYATTFSQPLVTVFPDIVQVVDSYDQVYVSEYRSSIDPLELPWPEKPEVGANDWVVADNINSCFKKLTDNLNYLESRSRYYPATFSDYFGWLGPVPPSPNALTACDSWTWDDVDCFTTSLPYEVTWRDVLSAQSPADNGQYVNCGTWALQECGSQALNPTCEGKYCINWNWRDRATNTLQFGTPFVTWQDTVSGGQYQKRWYFEPCATSLNVPCDEGKWNVNIPQLDDYYSKIVSINIPKRCTYRAVASRKNNLFLAQRTEVRYLSSNHEATYYNLLAQIDEALSFSNIVGLGLDSNNKIYVLDNTISQVAAFIYNFDTPRDRPKLYVSWGGFGTGAARTKFSNPNDLHIDQLDNIWITDTGNNCIKHYSNSGSWLNTFFDNEFKINAPLSVCVDSQRNVHVLTAKEIRVYTYSGQFLFTYNYSTYSSAEPRKINTSHNREVIYIAFQNAVVKFFRTGAFAGIILSNQQEINNINGLYHDEYRNLLILNDDKILKYPDLMRAKQIKGPLPKEYWSLDEIYIHKEEYVQSWVYNKSFQRMWDNIELYRNTLQFTAEKGCQSYIPPVHDKSKIIVGQNELVTAATINRVLGYLWDNFKTLTNYFDPTCVDELQV